MPRQISVPIDNQDYTSSSVDQLVIIEQDNYAHEPVDISRAYRYQALITEGSLAVISTAIPVPVKKGNAAESAARSGPETIGNTLSINASVSDSGPLLAAMYTQANELGWRLRGGTGQTLPAAQTVVANTGDLTSIVAQTIADNLSSTVNEVQVTVTPIVGDIDVVTAQSITTDGNLTLADALDTGATDFSGTTVLSFTLAGTPGLASADTPGTYTIVYEDLSGNSQTVIVSFANTELASTKTATLTDMDHIDSIANAGFNAGTVTITTPDQAAVTLADGVSRAAIEIWGTDANGNQISEEISFTAANRLAPQTSDKFFADITHVFAASYNSLFSGDEDTDRTLVAGWSVGNFQMTARDEAVVVIARPQDQRQNRFWTIEYAKGGKPSTYYGLNVDQVTFTLARDATRIDQLTFLGRRGVVNQNLAKEVPTVDPPTGRTTYPAKTDISSLEFANPDVYVGYSAFLEIDGVRQPITTLSMTLTNGFIDAGLATGVKYNQGKSIRNAMRMCQIAFTVRDSFQQDYFNLYTNDIPLDNVNIVWFFEAEGAFGYRETWSFPQCKIMAAPDPATAGQAAIDNPITMNAFDESFGDPMDYSIRMELPRYVAPRTYS